MKKHSIKGRCIILNWELLPDEEKVEGHFIIVDDKDREGQMSRLLESFSKQGLNSPFEKVRSIEGKVVGTKYRYLFESYYSPYNPSFLKLNKIFPGKKIIRDRELSERKRSGWSIEDYVANVLE